MMLPTFRMRRKPEFGTDRKYVIESDYLTADEARALLAYLQREREAQELLKVEPIAISCDTPPSEEVFESNGGLTWGRLTGRGER